jgi:hypothetical protein
MQTETVVHTSPRGWSTPVLPPLDSEDTLVLAFGPSSLLDDPGPTNALLAAYPRATVIGCSTAGEIFDTAINDDSLSVAICRFERTHLRSVAVPVGSAADSHAAGRHLASSLARPDLRGVLVISDGLLINGSELLRGINEELPPTVVVTGGLAGDGDRFRRTWVMAERQIKTGYVAAVGFYGDGIRIAHGSKGGWDTFGPARVVTRAAGNVLYEIDGRPALALYKEYLGDRADGLPGTALLFPLALRASRGDAKSLVRTVLSVDETSQSMTFAGDIPQGAIAQLMRANFDRLIEGASDAAKLTTARSTEDGPSLAIAISCVGRRLVLGQRAEEEVEAAKEALPRATRLVGFYSYGEISPYATGRCDLHNQTMTLTNLQEP